MTSVIRYIFACLVTIILFVGFFPEHPENKVPERIKLLGAVFLGGSGMDEPYEPSIAVAADFSVYISGFTLSTDFPVTPDAYNTEFSGGRSERFVSRFNNGFSRLTASTYIGSPGTSPGLISGNGDDLGHAIAVDREGNVFIAGYTESADFPVTDGAFDTGYNGGRDVFVSKFNSSLTTLLASTYVGGTGDEGYRWPRIDMAVNAAGDVIVAGITHSVDFPVTANAYDREFNGGSESGDAFLVILDSKLSSLKAATYIGGSDNEWRVAVRALDDGVLICGETESKNFPTSAKAFRRTLNVIKDVFVARFNKELSALEASTLFGGSKLDEALDIEISGSGDIYITGYTESEDLPVTAGSYGQTWNGGNRDGYAAKFDYALTQLISSTFFGGSEVDFPRGIALGLDGAVYITGNTTSLDFPVTDNGNFSDYKGGSFRGDAFLVIFDGGLRELQYAGLLGGEADDTGFCIDIDADGNIIIGGTTNSETFPMTLDSYDKTFNKGPNDCFLVKLSGKEQ